MPRIPRQSTAHLSFEIFSYRESSAFNRNTIGCDSHNSQEVFLNRVRQSGIVVTNYEKSRRLRVLSPMLKSNTMLKSRELVTDICVLHIEIIVLTKIFGCLAIGPVLPVEDWEI